MSRGGRSVVPSPSLNGADNGRGYDAAPDGGRLLNDQDVKEMLARMDERTKNTQEDIAEIKARLSDKYVTVEAFEPVRRVVFGLVAALVLGVVGALLKLVVG